MCSQTSAQQRTKVTEVSPHAESHPSAPNKRIQLYARNVDILQDLPWDESIAAAKLASSFKHLDSFREAITDDVYRQPSRQVRARYAQYFVKWFLPSLSLSEPVVFVWKAFQDEAALQHVMRWRYITSNPLVAEFVDGPFAAVAPGQAVDATVGSFLVQTQAGIKDKTRERLRANLRKIGLVVLERNASCRIVPEVSPRAIAVLIAHLFAKEPQVLTWNTLVGHPWWKRLGIVDELTLRAKLHETAEKGLIAGFRQMDTLDQITTRFSVSDFASGKATQR